jgi:sporulation protein YlmC with PRC-barrel domain
MERKLLQANKVEGLKVRNRQGMNLGTIKDLLIDRPSGRVAYVVISYGSTLGIGGKLYPLPWDALTYDTDTHTYVFDMPEETIKGAQGFKSEEDLVALGDPERAQAIHQRYDSRATWYRVESPPADDAGSQPANDPANDKERPH